MAANLAGPLQITGVVSPVFFDCVEAQLREALQVVLFEKEVKSHPVSDGGGFVRFHPRWLAAVMPFRDRICGDIMAQFGVTGLDVGAKHDTVACTARLLFVSSDGKQIDVLKEVVASLDTDPARSPAVVIAGFLPAPEVPPALCLEASPRSPVRVSAPTPTVVRRRGENLDHSKFSSRASSVRLPHLFPVSRPVSAQPSEASLGRVVMGLDEGGEGQSVACVGAEDAGDLGAVRVADVVEQLSPPRSATPLVTSVPPEILRWGRTLSAAGVSAAVGGWTGLEVAVRSQPLSLLGAVAAGLGANVRVVVDSDGAGVRQVQEVIDHAAETARGCVGRQGTSGTRPHGGSDTLGERRSRNTGSDEAAGSALELADESHDQDVEAVGREAGFGAGASQCGADHLRSDGELAQGTALALLPPVDTVLDRTLPTPCIPPDNIPALWTGGDAVPVHQVVQRQFAVSICSRIDQAISDIVLLPGIQAEAMPSLELQGWQVVCGGPVVVAVRQ
mmetsp:Transcript_67210/g.153951  ORF Transcript_67210/g.153951 Transcript_67210/m.153951 type:complete len:504 (-) Transcript_67210:114-1625(-)